MPCDQSEEQSPSALAWTILEGAQGQGGMAVERVVSLGEALQVAWMYWYSGEPFIFAHG